MNFNISDVKEKEIDFILAEEFVASPSFLSLFINTFDEYKTSNFQIEKIRRSHTDSYGESDLELFLINEEENCLVLLIENKVSAQFQLDQLKRYKKRAESYLNQNKCDDYKIILIAPKNYGYDIDSLEIDARIYYEDLIRWFDNDTINNSRSIFKKYLLEKALEKAKYGYQLVEDEKATMFWLDYWKLSNRIFPLLNMPKPGKKPSSSSFVYFYPPKQYSKISFIHKFAYGNVDLQIANTARNAGVVKQKLSNLIPSDTHIQKAGKSVVIRKEVPILDINRSIESQETVAKKCLKVVENLYNWYLNNENIFKEFVEK
jgi:hypothetical protein